MAKAFSRAALALACLAVTAAGRLAPPPTKGSITLKTAAPRKAAVPISRGGLTKTSPSYSWAILHNWLYFLSLGLCIPVLPRVIAATVNEDGSPRVTTRSARVGGDVEGLDKLLTFFFVGTLGALSDVVGRTPLIALSALGYLATILVQARATRVAHFFVADAIDGMTSCMNAVCGAYVADATAAAGGGAQAAALGLFQGLSTGGAFCVGFPVSGLLSKGGKSRRPMYVAAALQALNAFLALFVTPESTTPKERKAKQVKRADCNPFGSLAKLDFDRRGPSLLRAAALAFGLVWLGNLALNATFVNFVNARFGWGPQQSGPLLVLVGLMLAVVPRLVVPRLGVETAIKAGCLVYALGFVLAGTARSGRAFVASIAVCGLGCVAVPALTALVASQAPEGDRGAVLGGLQTLQELVSAAGYPLYGRLLAAGLRPQSPVGPGAPFFAAALVLVGAAAYAHAAF